MNQLTKIEKRQNRARKFLALGRRRYVLLNGLLFGLAGLGIAVWDALEKSGYTIAQIRWIELAIVGSVQAALSVIGGFGVGFIMWEFLTGLKEIAETEDKE